MKRLFVLVLLVHLGCLLRGQSERPIWPADKARAWYATKGWPRGSDFIVSTAINQLEMWQAATFDPKNIDRELGYAQSIGLNCMRVFLHHLAWQENPAGFMERVRQYLDIADRHHINTIFVFFDDCWNESYHAGPQPAPKTGVHNSGWVRDPGALFYGSTRGTGGTDGAGGTTPPDPGITSTLEKYVKDVLTTFRQDQRVLLWDLYNEPGNNNNGNKSLPLLEKIFHWGREVNPDQPLSAGVWSSSLHDLNAFQLSHSDVITYHDYQPLAAHQHTVDTLKTYGRPLICTEYMARTHNSTFATIMPMLKKENVGAINWGLVAGKTNTKYSWEKPMPDGAEPPVWFHEIFRPDGQPYDPKETELIKSLTGVK
jgi:hypothetical protein